MVEICVFQNGSISAPLKRTDDDQIIPARDLDGIHEDKKRTVKDQIEMGIKAEEYGYDRVFYSEHHFQPTGNEFGTNPLQSQTYVAAQTDEIKLAQLTNVITWHDPVRFSEQAAILDIMSDGRAEIGIGRGYQPRECEVLGQYWGGTIQDQEKNRHSFLEKFELIKQCWTDDAVKFNGEYHTVPPSHTKWHHTLDKAYFDDDVTERTTDEMMNWDDSGDLYQDLWSEVVSGATTLNRISVFPQPIQDPHPQLWIPMNSYRTIEFAAQNGVNGAFLALPDEALKGHIAKYFQEVEEAGWPDHRPEHDGEPFTYGWDEDRQRGVMSVRSIWNTDVVDEETTEQWWDGQENAWNFYRPLLNVEGIFGVEDIDYITKDLLRESQVLAYGSTEEIIDNILSMADVMDADGLGIIAYFDTPSIGPDVEARQMEVFAEEVVPHLEAEYPSPT